MGFLDFLMGLKGVENLSRTDLTEEEEFETMVCVDQLQDMLEQEEFEEQNFDDCSDGDFDGEDWE